MRYSVTIVLMIVVAFVLYRRTNEFSIPIRDGDKIEDGISQNGNHEQDELQEIVNRHAHDTELTTDELELALDEDSKIRLLFMKAAYEQEEKLQNGDVEFYGKVVDMEGRPVQGASVSVLVYHYPMTFIDAMKSKGEGGSFHVSVESDDDGKFEVSGFRAQSISFSDIHKEGYECAGGIPMNLETIFMPNYPHRYEADRENPVIFRMQQASGD